MTCHSCSSQCKRFGRHRNGLQRFRCNQCRRTFTEDHEKARRPQDEIRLPVEKVISVLQLLLEGMSIRSAERITGVHRDTILRLLVIAGQRCEERMLQTIHAIPVKDVQVDEIWGFVFKKEGHKWAHEKQIDELGDAYCFIGIERDTKLILAWHLGKRNAEGTETFIAKLAWATSKERYQLTTDGFKYYVPTIKAMMRDRVDYAQLIKVYGVSRDGEQRYSPGEVVNAVRVPVVGNPDNERICTSHIERQNLSIRMGMRRMTRLTNAFSKKWANLEAAYALWFAYYNFCRRHSSLKGSPAMECGLADRIWSLRELLAV